MKTICTCLLFCSFFAAGMAQDTTSLRWAGINDSLRINYFEDDSTYMSSVNATFMRGFAIFLNSQDSLLYAILELNNDGDRNLYRINPFNGSYVLVHDFAVEYISSADISADGSTVYVIEGQANEANLGIVTSLNLSNLTESLVDTALGEANLGIPNGPSSYGIEFNPTDTSLYIYEGSYDGFPRLQKLNLNSLINTVTPLVYSGYQIHGARWTGNGSQFFVFSGWGEDYLLSDLTGNNLTPYFSLAHPRTADIEEFPTLRAPGSVVAVCPNSPDGVEICLIYAVPSFAWYKDGVLLPLTNDTIYVTAPGTYRALFQIGSSGNFMWSEPIQITNYTVPVVNISQASNDSLICPSDTIVLQGASGGTLQWYLNGTSIPLANSNTYAATTAGSYNQMKTNASGCSDTALVAYIIYDDPNCGSSINNETTYNISLTPNPVTNQLIIKADEVLNSVCIFNIIGKEVYSNHYIGQDALIVDFTLFPSGTYLVQSNTNSGCSLRKIIK